MPGWLERSGGSVTLSIYVQPRASRDEVVGLHGDRLKIRLAAPPVDGAANAQLCRFIADLFGVPPARVRLLKGQAGRSKLVAVAGVSELPSALARFASAASPAEPT